jgi:hypothetical protein
MKIIHKNNKIYYKDDLNFIYDSTTMNIIAKHVNDKVYWFDLIKIES